MTVLWHNSETILEDFVDNFGTTFWRNWDNFETPLWLHSDYWQSVPLPCGQQMAIFFLYFIPSRQWACPSLGVFSQTEWQSLWWGQSRWSLESSWCSWCEGTLTTPHGSNCSIPNYCYCSQIMNLSPFAKFNCIAVDSSLAEPVLPPVALRPEHKLHLQLQSGVSKSHFWGGITL